MNWRGGGEWIGGVGGEDFLNILSVLWLFALKSLTALLLRFVLFSLPPLSFSLFSPPSSFIFLSSSSFFLIFLFPFFSFPSLPSVRPLVGTIEYQTWLSKIKRERKNNGKERIKGRQKR